MSSFEPFQIIESLKKLEISKSVSYFCPHCGVAGMISKSQIKPVVNSLDACNVEIFATVVCPNPGCKKIAAYVEKYNMEVYWNTDVSQNYAEAVTDSGVLKMWLEDEKALEEKMKLIQEYDLAGVAEWKLGFERDDVWKIISSYVQ